MADLTVTVANVRPLPGCIIRRFKAAATLTPGQPVYVSANDTVDLADASALPGATCIGLVVAGADGAVSFAAGDWVDVVLFGPVEGFATNLAAGTRVYVDDDAGILADAVGTKVTLVGVGLNTTVLLVTPNVVTVA